MSAKVEEIMRKKSLCPSNELEVIPLVRSSTSEDTYISRGNSIDVEEGSEPGPTAPVVPSKCLSPIALVAMAALAVQFGLQPILIQNFVGPDVLTAALVSCVEMSKLALALFMLRSSGPESVSKATKGWNLVTSFKVAGLPAILFAIQGFCNLIASKNLDPVTFNVINQSKTLSAALFCFLLMGRRQSFLQLVALVLLLAASLVIEGVIDVGAFFSSFAENSSEDGTEDTASESTRNYSLGITMIIIGSSLSGLSGALAQKSLQMSGGGRDSFLFTAELSFFSAAVLLLSLIATGDLLKVITHGFFQGWNIRTLIPIFSQAIGGVCIGIITKHAGAVVKGFVLVIGLVLTALFRSIAHGGGLAVNEMTGMALVAVATTVHMLYPYKSP
eukprot:CAMPEP_0194346306 /NCGR_PEP_ID=MMETSP0171-20130528/105349_1 /TAXON_ID=218684 /ORGANISM="Corethron pennatum, Strain L29A3" /LENGTH=387 /DNA_ID=CAMNT_0039113411 /DNA_START=495 /DNA_END=1658 /DNA_ORIENTATION=-